jgi:hypothetical protein
VYVNNVRNSFTLETFDPSKQTVRQFVGKLQNWANRISTAERSINEDEIHEKLLNSLPSDSVWQTAKMFCLRQSLGLEESINLLSSNKTPTVQESAASVRDKSRGRRGGRGNQGRGSTSGRGSGYQGKGRGKNQGSRSQSNSNQSQSNSSRYDPKDRVEKSGPLCY